MERRTRKRRPRRLARWAARIAASARWCRERVQAVERAMERRLRPWRPVVLADARRSRARRLRRALSRATRMHFRALGVAPPEHLLIVVQRAVVDGDRPLAALLQVYEDASGVRRHVLFLALSVGEESMSDGVIVATLRQQLHAMVSEALGRLVCAVPCEPARTARPASGVPLRPCEQPAAVELPSFEEEAPFPDDAQAPAEDGAYAVAAER